MTAKIYTAKFLVQNGPPTYKDAYRTVNFARLSDLATFLYHLSIGVKCADLNLSENRCYVVWTGKFFGSYHTRNTQLETTEITGDKEFVDYCLSRYRARHLGMTRARLVINGKKLNLFGTRGQMAWKGRISVQVISDYDFDYAQARAGHASTRSMANGDRL